MAKRIFITIKHPTLMPEGAQQISKEDLLEGLQRRVADHILEPANAALLKKLILNADDPNEAMNIAALGTTYKRTGFIFDKRLEKSDNDIHYFRKNEDLSFHTDNSPSALTHKLIIGDNYPALQNLLIQYHGQVSVVYIDPPYGKDSMGEFAKTNYENAISRDNLLSMLYPRLQLARQLLSDDGVIFCSIDDRNQAYVKGLFDEVFGERNFVSCISWQSNPGGDKSDYVENTLQYILLYCNEKSSLNDLGIYEETEINSYPLIDEYGRYRKGGQLEKWGNDDTIHTHPNLAYSIYYSPTTKDVKILFDYNQQELNADRTLPIRYLEPDTELTKEGYVCIRPRETNVGEGGRWRVEPKTFFERLEKNSFIFQKQESGYKIYEKDRCDSNKFIKAKNFISSKTAKQSASDITDIFGTKIFSYPKPVSLIEYIISLVQVNQDKAFIVLDFFAGSGTTGHAVLDLNATDGSKRQFILCQMNEKTDTTPNGIAYDVTCKRLKRVMTGRCYDGTSDFKWAKEHKPYGGNLDVYEIKTVMNSNASEGKTPFDVIDETLYGQKRFQTLREKVKWVCENFAHTQKYLEEYKDWEDRQKEEDHVTGD